MFKRNMCFITTCILTIVYCVYISTHIYNGYMATTYQQMSFSKTEYEGRDNFEDFSSKQASFTPTIYQLTEEEEKQLTEKLNQASKNRKVIVIWGGFNRPERTGNEMNRNCGYCSLVAKNNTRIVDSHTAAVVFTYRKVNFATMPSKSLRRPDQLYIWLSGESPSSLQQRSMNFTFETDRQFNATMTLRRDSDIFYTYGNAFFSHQAVNKLFAKEYDGKFENMLRVKTNHTIAIISNCMFSPAARIRIKIITEMSEYGLRIDKFGSCFNNTLERASHLEILKTYKFYLAFENSYHCKDYITEKFFKIGLQNGVVPVVWGPKRDDYNRVAPPNSFIHVDDFSSLQELVSYLDFLDNNDEEYLKYFGWYLLPGEDMPNYGRQTAYCQICRIVNGINIDERFKPDFNSMNPKIPLFTNGTARRTITEHMENVIYGREDIECLESDPDVFKNEKYKPLKYGSSQLYEVNNYTNGLHKTINQLENAR
ncbi:4-galactosyl-N-acetylglucosaminide 3-alpha-L-fucosyltransferase FUT6-like isoform X1 [Styela clava]